MERFVDFLLGVGASLVAAALITRLNLVSIRLLRYKIIRFVAHDEIAFKAKNLEQIGILLKKSIEKSQELKILTGRGHLITNERGEINSVLMSNNLNGIKCLFSSDSQYLKNRAKEYCTINTSFSEESYLKSVRESIDRVEKLAKKDSRVEIKTHNMPLAFRFILTSNHLFITYIESKKAIKDTTVLVYENTSKTFHGYKRYFDSIWKNTESQSSY